MTEIKEMDLQIATKMAKLAEAAYLDEGEAVQQLYFKMGYLGSKFFEVDGAQCYAVWNRSEYVLCFRGTEPTEIGDVLADLNARPVQSQTDGWVHAGFRGELDKLWPQIKDHHVKHKDKRFYITGHSLGAAMATIACSRFENAVKVWELYTFGSPRVGTQSFVDEIKGAAEFLSKTIKSILFFLFFNRLNVGVNIIMSPRPCICIIKVCIF